MCCGAWLGTRSGRLLPTSLNEAPRPPIPTRTVWSKMRQEHAEGAKMVFGSHYATTNKVWEAPTQHNLAPSLGLHVLSVERFLQTAASGLRRPSLSISTYHGVLDKLWTAIFENIPIIPPLQRLQRGVRSWTARDTLQKARLGARMGLGTPKCMYAHHSEASPGEGWGANASFSILPTSQVARNTIRNTMAFLKVNSSIYNCILLESY